MTNLVPFSGAANASGGYLLPPEQGEILVNGILVETGVIQIAGDARSTSARKTNFPIWLGRPTAGPVGEGKKKGVTGASFSQAELNIKKFATTVLFTDEQIEDLQNGDLNVLVDAGVRQALSVSIDSHGAGAEAGNFVSEGCVFDSNLLAAPKSSKESVTTNVGAEGVVIAKEAESRKQGNAIQKAVSAALSKLEENGYGNPSDIGVLLGFGFQHVFRDARDGFERPLYDAGQFAGQTVDPLYGLARGHSTNLVGLSAEAPTIHGTTTEKSSKVKITTRGKATLSVGQPIEGEGIPAESVIRSLIGIPGEESELEIGKNTGAGITAVEATASHVAEVLTLKRQVAVVVHRPNVHVRVRQDVVVKTSNEATVEIEPGVSVSLFQENLHAILYETRLGFMVHDPSRAIVPLYL